MTCKFERVPTLSGSVVVHLSGRIDGTSLDALRELTEKEKTTQGGLAIDLAEVTLVIREAIRTLTLAETSGIELRNCPAYVREWISREREHDLSG
jgi:hypothetical protein